MTDLSSVLPTMPTYFGAQIPAPPPASGASPFMDALRTVTAVRPPVPRNPLSLVPPAAGPPANPQGYFGAQIPAPTRPTQSVVRPAAPAAPAPAASLGGGAPPETGGMAAAPNVIQGGAFPPSEVAGMVHPAEHAIAYQQNLARQRDIQPFNGTNTNEFTTLDANSPRMEGPAPAAPNVIRGGIPDNGGGNGGRMNAIQFDALRPILQSKMEAAQRIQQLQEESRLNIAAHPEIAAKQGMAQDSQRQADLTLAAQGSDPVKAATAQRGLDYYKSAGYKQLYMQRLLLMGLPAAEASMIINNIK